MLGQHAYRRQYFWIARLVEELAQESFQTGRIDVTTSAGKPGV
jgi:hypothetical protein